MAYTTLSKELVTQRSSKTGVAYVADRSDDAKGVVAWAAQTNQPYQVETLTDAVSSYQTKDAIESAVPVGSKWDD